MKPFFLLSAIALLVLAGCTTEPDAATFTTAMNTYLAKRGDLCLAKDRWPIDVTQRDIDSGARNAVQMPVLERLGLVSSSVADAVIDDEGTKHPIQVRRYALTEAGRRFMVQRDATHSDFCAARLSLDRVVGWQLGSGPQGAGSHALVTYTYKIEAAPWMQDAEAQKVFPVIANLVRSAGSARLEENFNRTPQGWVAVDLQGS
jgi:hypothetical protein